MQNEKEFASLTGLRFAAAFYVFLFHMHIRWPISSCTFIRNILSQGAIGMSLFFILSGFVLAYRYTDSSVTTNSYFINRFARIYPIYLVAAIITLPWIGVGFGSYSLHDFFNGALQIVLMIFINIFIIQAWFPQLFSYWNDGGSWSISVEVFCYLLIPFILPSLKQYSIKQLYVVAFVCYILAVLPGLSIKLGYNAVFYSMPIYRLPEFLLGVCAYLVLRCGARYSWGVIPQILVLLTFLLYLGFFGLQMPLYVGHNWITLPVITFMIFSLSNNNGPLALLLANQVFVWLGKISYCFYSFQALLILWLIDYHDKLVQFFPLLSNSKVLTIITFMVLVVMSAIGYYLIEEPARKWIKYYHKKTACSLSSV